MSMETSDAAERILTLERKIFRLRKEADDLVVWRYPAIEQGIAMAWAYGPRVQNFNCNFSLTVRGCNSLGVPGAGVTVTETATGTVLASGPTNSSGVFAVNPLVIHSNPAAVTIDIVSPANDRLADQSFSTSLTPTTISLTRTLAITDTSLWACNSTKWYPVPSVLHVTDSILGSLTMAWDAPNARHRGNLSLSSFPGCPPCGGGPGSFIVTYTLVGATLTVSHLGTNPNCCPAPLATFLCGDGNGLVTAIPANPPYSATRTAADFGVWHCGASVTLTISE